MGVARVAGVGDLPGRHLQGREQGGSAVAHVVVGGFLGQFGRIGRIGAVRSSAWICDFSSIQTTTALSGGFKYNPTTSRTLASNSGSVENLNLSRRHGCRFHSRQIRATEANEIPKCLPSSRANRVCDPQRLGRSLNGRDDHRDIVDHRRTTGSGPDRPAPISRPPHTGCSNRSLARIREPRMRMAAMVTMSSSRVFSPVVSQSIATASPGGGSSNKKRKAGSRNRYW